MIKADFAQQVDTLSGIEFEKYVSDLLEARGYETSLTPASGDLGVGILAFKAGSKVAIQVKRQQANVSRRAVSDAVTGKQFYGCDQAWVITNSEFTADAKRIAEKTKCRLVDRCELIVWHKEARVRHVEVRPYESSSSKYQLHFRQSEQATSLGQTSSVTEPVFKADKKWHIDEPRTFVQATYRLNRRTDANWTPLMLAAKYSERDKVVSALIDMRPEDLGKLNSFGKRAADYAAKNAYLNQT